MNIFEEMKGLQHQQVVFAQDEPTGLKAIIAIHNNTLGPALGGTRIWNYASEAEALHDVLRLSRGMTLKNAAAGLALGGGKAVIIGEAKTIKTPALLRAYGRMVQSLGGLYYTAADVNTSTADMDQIKQYTEFVVGTSGISADPSPYTAQGVLNGIRAGLTFLTGSDSLKGKVVAVQGLGSVGAKLCALLHQAGATLKVFDLDQAKVEQAVRTLGAEATAGDEILTTSCDILAPCALGAVVHTKNLPHLQCKMIAGSANNILADNATGDLLAERNILYLPDYIINAGGVINCGAELEPGGYSKDFINKKVADIYQTTATILALAKEKGIPTYQAADAYAFSVIERAMQHAADKN